MGLSIGNKIELVELEQVIKNEKNKKVYVSKIYDIMPGNLLQIAMPIHEGKIVPLSVNDKYSACFYTDRGLLQCNIIVSSRYKSGNLFFLEVVMLGELAKVQRREFYRYNCSLEAKIRVVSDEEYATGMPDDINIPEDALPWNDAKISDISGGGVRLFQHYNLDKNEVIKIKFAVAILDEVICFNLYGRILASTSVRGRSDIFEQRIEFMKISQEDRDKIVKFIFESERMNRAKEAGLI
ncbi:MAG: flagellar brake protein [Lachnospiraceae bacterium]|nr:flagellar brake protein [Lachnospiraceae bacterium]